LWPEMMYALVRVKQGTQVRAKTQREGNISTTSFTISFTDTVQILKYHNLAAPLFFSHLQKTAENLYSRFHPDQELAQYVKVTVQNTHTNLTILNTKCTLLLQVSHNKEQHPGCIALQSNSINLIR